MTLAPPMKAMLGRLSDGNPRQIVTTTANVAPAAFAPAPAFVITNASPLAVEKPKRSSVLNLFARATKTPKSNRSINNLTTGGNDAPLARPTSIGLGLEGMLDRDLSQMTTSKSLANRSSWESNLFYDETMDRGVSSAAAPGTPSDEEARLCGKRTSAWTLRSRSQCVVGRVDRRCDTETRTLALRQLSTLRLASKAPPSGRRRCRGALRQSDTVELVEGLQIWTMR